MLDFEAARRAVARHARTTPLLLEPGLSERLGRDVFFKVESLQPTGSFKVRGAAARLEALSPQERRRGVVTCSSGNHGRAVAYVAGRMGIPATIYVPRWVDEVKLAGIRASGADAVFGGDTFDEAEAVAMADAESQGRAWISAYDDPRVIAGQGTIGEEILDGCETLPAYVLAPLSGGGLAGGIAAAMRARAGDLAPEVVGISAERAAVMLASIRAGRPVELPEHETLASALAGGIGLDNQYSFALVRDLVHAHATVDESEIRTAMRYAVERARLVVEGGGAVGLAALLGERWTPSQARPGSVVVIISGGNVATETLAQIIGAG
jgi:threonine dehydratase